MTKYLLAFALSYVAALLVFAAFGVLSLFRWPVGPVPAAYGLLWTLVPLATACLLGRVWARRWGGVVGAVPPTWTLILLAVLAVLTLLSARLNALQPFAAPGRALGVMFRLESTLLPLTLCGNLLYPLAFHLGWRLGA